MCMYMYIYICIKYVSIYSMQDFALCILAQTCRKHGVLETGHTAAKLYVPWVSSSVTTQSSGRRT